MYLFAIAVMGMMVGLTAALFTGCQTLHGYGPAAIVGTAGSGLAVAVGRALHINGPHDNLGFLWAMLGAAVAAWLWCRAVRRHRV